MIISMKSLFVFIFSVLIIFEPIHAQPNISPPPFSQLFSDARLKQQQGFLFQANELSIQAYETAQSSQEEIQIILLLSQINYQRGNNKKALALLQQLEHLNNTKIRHSILFNKANIAVADNDNPLAISLYEKILKSPDKLLSIAAHINLSDLENKEQAITLLKTALKMMTNLSASDHKTEYYLSLAQSALELDSRLTLNCLEALDQIDLSNNLRYLSQKYALKSKLYYKHQKESDALILIDKAIFYAQQETDLLMQWEWIKGRILTKSSPDKAISTYRRAISHLNKIKNDIPVRYIDGRSSFKELLSPLYLELTDLLLTRADHISRTANEEKNSQAQSLLAEAQNTIELLKTSELLDYFKNSCAVIQYPLMDLTKKSPQTAIVYPIVFEHHMDILVSIKGQLKHFRVAVKKADLYRMTKRVLRKLRPKNGLMKALGTSEIKKLYAWLIQPIKKELDEKQIDTLIFVPDDTLRTLPIAMLWDGQHYLIENYAIATLPGLSLLDPKPIPAGQFKISLAGVSRPGEVVKQLYAFMDLSLIDSDFIQSTQKRQININQLALRELPSAMRGIQISTQIPVIEDNNQQLRALQDSLALPGVIDELNSLSSIMPSSILLDDDFQLVRFKEEIKGARIIHIASHAIFSGEPESSYVMAHDKILDMNEIDGLFKAESFNQYPVELLTLSACQTAEGDDRSPLGLAGVALKSGARSVMGSLWPISDMAAKTLFPIFYRQLVDKKLSKAKSLQKAQISLIKNKETSHPFFWAPFVMVGNWL
ncbi:MAG: CHAT domain-containing protein [gamma proteobacterium symbiont of Taylorina sp.]|nr:CHAT domain-containing protein [gamma proteobacterium symbiont of Taylorina sp.]